MFVNTNEFRREGNKFLKYGLYCGDPVGSAPYYEYWSEQLRRCRDGFSVGGTRVTGHHYFYMNFCQIKLTELVDGKKAGGFKTVSFPGFWDGDYEYFHALERAAAEGKHLIVAKARRKGFSYKNAAIAANIYNTRKNSYTLLCAHDKKYLYPKGIMTMVTDYMNFLNEHTGWQKRRQGVDKINHKRASYLEYINKQGVEKGYKSEVEAITFKDNPDAARGKDASLVIFEECGAFDNLKASYLATRPCVEDGGVITGQIVLFGTGGDMDGGTIDFESMFYNPEAYDLYPFDNIWDEGAQGSNCGFFFPSYQNKIGYMDKEGNSLTQQAKQEEDAKRDQLKKEAKDASTLDRYITEYPWMPKEAFLQQRGNMFPGATLVDWRNQLMRTGLYKQMAVAGVLVEAPEGIEFRPDPRVRPIEKFPLNKTDDSTGAVVVYQSPAYRQEAIPDDLYFIVHDPYGSDGFGASLGSAYVMKRINNMSKPDDMIVASYVGRPESQDEYNYNLFLLAQYYNARIGFENDRGEVIPYAKRKKLLHYLLPEAELFDKTSGIRIKKLNRTYGTSMGSKQRKNQAEIYLRDWLKTPRGQQENGERKLNLHYIYDIALIDELIKYNNKGNFDRVSALLVGMFHMKDLYNKEFEQEMEQSEDSFFNRRFFS